LSSELYNLSRKFHRAKKSFPHGKAAAFQTAKPFSTVEYSEIKLKEVIENRKHEKITNERG